MWDKGLGALEKLKERVERIDHYAVLCIEKGKDESVKSLEVRYEKGGLVFGEMVPYQDAESAIDSLSSHDLPIVLLVTGAGTLDYDWEDVFGSGQAPDPAMFRAMEDHEVLTRLLVGAKPEEFIVQRSEEGVSVSQSKPVSQWVDRLHAAGLVVLEAYVGRAVTGAVRQRGTLGKPGRQPDDTGKVELFGEAIDAEAAELACAAVGFASNESFSDKQYLPIARKEIEARNRVRRIGSGMLGLAFAVVLINALWNVQLRQKHSALQVSTALVSSQLRELQLFEADIEDRERFLTETGWLKVSQPSEFADRIAATVPESVQLTLMNVYPLIDEGRGTNDPAVFAQDRIMIRGTAEDSYAFSRWTETLEQQVWVSKVVNRESQRANTRMATSFEVEIYVGS